MKRFDLNTYCVKEIDVLESQKMYGGGILEKLLGPWGILVAAGLYIYDNWDDIEAGWDSYTPIQWPQ